MRPGLFAHMIVQHEGAAGARGESECFHVTPVCVRADAYRGSMRTSERRVTRFYLSVIVMAVLGGTALVAAMEGAFPIALATAAMLVPAAATAAVLFALC